MSDGDNTEKGNVEVKTKVKAERRNFRKRPPKTDTKMLVIRVGIDYPAEKWAKVQSSCGAGMYPSGAAIIREALDKVVREYKKKNGKQQ